MAKEIVEVLIEGGKATAAPPLGPALGPMGINIGQVVTDINKKTQDFKGMQVPVKVNIDTDSKEYTITVGTPPASALIKQEANIKKGAANPVEQKVADLKIEQIIKIAKMKEDALLGKDAKEKVKEIVGTCQSMGVMVEGTSAYETITRIKTGEFDTKILSGKTELTAEEITEQKAEQEKLVKELEEQREKFLGKAKEIVEANKNFKAKEIQKLLENAEIPSRIIQEVMPKDEEDKEGEVKKEPKKK